MASTEQENAETLHFILTPFRMLRGFLKFTVFLGMLIYWLFLSQVGWITDIGPRSEWTRRDQVAEIQNSLQRSFDGEGYPWADLDVNFRDRATWKYTDDEFPGEEWMSKDHFWVNQRYNYTDESDQDPYHTLVPFVIVASSKTMPNRGIPFCHVGNTGIFDSSLGSWSDRGDYALDRKSARMRRDYETAALMVAALRSTLAHLKAHQSVQNDYGPEEDDMPLADSFCNADGASAKFYTPDEIAEYRAATYEIHLDDIPVVRFRYVHFPLPPWNRDDPNYDDDPGLKLRYRRSEASMKIIGMCLAANCQEEDLNYYTTYAADLFAKYPPLSPGQLAAEKVLLNMSSPGFWEAQAQANGISDMKSVRSMNFVARWAAAEVEGDPIPRK